MVFRLHHAVSLSVKKVPKTLDSFNKPTAFGTPSIVDLAGIEPASESLSLEASPITAAYLHSLSQAAGGSLMTSVASSYARRLKALPASFPVIMTPVTGSTGTTGPTSSLRCYCNCIVVS